MGNSPTTTKQVTKQVSKSRQKQDQDQQLIAESCCRVLGEVEAIVTLYRKTFVGHLGEFIADDQDLSKRLKNIEMGMNLIETELHQEGGINDTDPPLQLARFNEQSLDHLVKHIKLVNNPEVVQYLLSVVSCFTEAYSTNEGKIGQQSQSFKIVKRFNQQVHRPKLGKADFAHEMRIDDEESQYKLLQKVQTAHQTSDLITNGFSKTGLPESEERYFPAKTPFVQKGAQFGHHQGNRHF